MRPRMPRGGWLIASAALALAAAGCCRKPPQSIMEVNLALGRAKDDCAVLYAPQDLAAIQRKVDEMNVLADGRKCARARSIAEPILPEVLALSERVRSRMDLAHAGLDAALLGAAAALERARAGEASRGVSGDLADAERALAEARRMSADTCAYPRAAALAREAAEAAERARSREEGEEARRP